MSLRNLLMAGVFVLGGCSLNPDLTMPNMPVAERYPLTADIDQHNAADLSWQAMFAGDPRLQKLIELALQNNRDYRVAMLNVETARAQFGIQRGARLPTIDANGTYVNQQINTDFGAGAQSLQFEQFGANIAQTSFEFDLFGRLRSLSQSAFERYLATEEGRKAAQISLVSSVVEAYLSERLAEEQLALTENTLQDWKKSLEITKTLHKAQQNSGLDIAEAESIVYQAQTDQEERLRARMRAENLLKLLVGSELPADLPAPIPLLDQPIITNLPAGLPSELLTNRPDIKQAEHELIASNADIGAARAAFFPNVSITSAIGFTGPQLNGLFSGDTKTWSYSPQITVPLFRGGRLKGELDLAKLRKSIAVTNYEKAIQVAFREVADGLAGRATYDNQVNAQSKMVEAETKRLRLSNMRYKAGLDSRLQLLDAQRTSYSAQQRLLDITYQQFQNTVLLYKALGGGKGDMPVNASE